MFEDLEHNQQHTNSRLDLPNFSEQGDGASARRDSSRHMSPDDTSEYLAAALDSSSSLSLTPARNKDSKMPKHAASWFDNQDEGFDDDPSYFDDDFGQEVDNYLALTPEQQVADMYRFFDVDRYRIAEQSRKRKIGTRVGIIVLVVVLLAIVAAAGIYVSNINARLSANVTNDLLDQLVQSQPGDPFYLLLLGVDKDQSRIEDTDNYGADEHAYRSDSIMLCRIDPKKVKVTMVSIHRDTLIDMDEHGNQKINAAYAFGGAAYATKVVSEFAGVPISHYAEVDLDRFIAIVDQVGGVTVNLPVPVHDPEYTQLDLPAGVQTLNGTEAALLCRCRHGYDEYGDGDRFRAANQRMVFSEVIKKVLRSDPATIASTVSTMADSVTTDMSVESILDLALQMQSLDVEKDISTGMEPTEGELINGTWYEICLVDEWQKMMTRVNKGLSPYDEKEGEHDSTAGIAGGVGEEGKRAAKAAKDSAGDDSSDDEDASTDEDAVYEDDSSSYAEAETYDEDEY